MNPAEVERIREVAGQHLRMVECAIISDEPAKAHAAVDRAFSACKRTDQVDECTRLEVILSARIASILLAGGIGTVGDVCQHTRDTLVAVHQIRYRSIDLIEQALWRYGYRLRRGDPGS